MTAGPEPPMRRPDPACPVCGKPASVARLLPFCSARCADIDLGRWLTGQYRIAGPASDEDAAEETAAGGST